MNAPIRGLARLLPVVILVLAPVAPANAAKPKPQRQATQSAHHGPAVARGAGHRIHS
jgi:hypothetical protein